MAENVKVYLIDRAGPQASAFADKLAGRQGVDLVGGAADVDEALEDITDSQADVILVGTDVGGAGVVAAVERVLTVAGDVAVVTLCTSADKALVAAAVRAGAAGSLDRTASDVDTIIALHVYRDRQHGVQVDMNLAEPPAEKRSLRVSGALPRFPTAPAAAVEPSSQPKPGPEPDSELGEPVTGEYLPSPEPEPKPDYTPQPEYNPPPDYTPPPDPMPAPEYPPPEPTPVYNPPTADEPDVSDSDLRQMREMLRGEAAAAASKGPKRKIGRLFGRRPAKRSPWGPQQDDDEETKST